MTLRAQGTFHLVLDGNIITDVQPNGTTISGNEVPLIYRAENMTDGDHELVGEVQSLANGTFQIYYFECGCPCSTPSQVQCANNLAASRIENSSGGGFDLLSAGPIAQDVPPQAIIVDDIDPTIKYHNESLWLHRSYAHSRGVGDYGVSDYGGSMSETGTPGASLSFSFDGVAIWYDLVPHAI